MGKTIQKSNICKQNWTKLGEIAQKKQHVDMHKQIQSKGCRNQDEDGYRRSAVVDRYLNFEPFNRVSVKAVVKPGNIIQPQPGGANTCTAVTFFCSIQNSVSGHVCPDRKYSLTQSLRPNQTTSFKMLPVLYRDGCSSRHQRGWGGEGHMHYSSPTFPLTCGGSGLWEDATGGGWWARGASTEFPLTLMCSHPP